MQKARGDKAAFLRTKWDRYLAMIENYDLWRDKEKRAFLAAPAGGIFPQRQRRPDLRPFLPSISAAA